MNAAEGFPVDTVAARQWWGWLAAFLIALFLFNIATITLFPIVWQDEVMFTEPAANWAQHGTLLSRAWFFDRETDVWAGNAPLYTILLTPWLKLFGVSPLAARAFGLLLGTVGIGAWIGAARRGGFLRGGPVVLLYAAVLLMAYGSGLNLRSGRYDGLGMLLVGGIALAATLRPGAMRAVMLLLLGALVPATGLHLIFLYCAFSLAAFLAYGWKSIPTIIPIGLGIGVGSAVLLLTLWHFGAAEHFLYSVSNLGKISGGEIPKDPSLFLVVLAAGIGTASLFFRTVPDRRARLILLYTPVVVVLFVVLGHFPNYYSWTVIFPLGLLALFDSEGQARRTRGGLWSQRAIVSVLLLAVAAGLPLQLATAMAGPSRDYDRVRQFVAANLGREDIAMVSPAAWYAAWPIAGKTYTTEYDLNHRFMTQADKTAVSVLILDPDFLPVVQKRMGHGWHRVALLSDASKPLPGLSAKFGAKLMQQYRLAIYRRD